MSSPPASAAEPPVRRSVTVAAPDHFAQVAGTPPKTAPTQCGVMWRIMARVPNDEDRR